MTNGALRFCGVLLALLCHSTTALGAEPVRVELLPTAAALPEGDIRVAIEKELGRPVTGKDPALPSDVTVGVVEGQLMVRVKQGNAVVERSVPLPSNLADVPLTVSLVVGNLARDQSVGLAPPPEAPDAAAPPAAAPRPPPRAKPMEAPEARLAEFPEEPFRRHWVGVHVAQDLASVGGNNVCDSNLGQKSSNFACFESGTTDRPFTNTPFPYRDTIQSGLVVATTRLLASYEYAPLSWLSLGGRFGYAFGGGPPAGQIPDENGVGSDGTPFFPAHLELGARVWIAPLTNRIFRAYFKASAGTAQVDAKVSIPEYDCTKAGSPDLRPEEAPSQSMDFTELSTGRVYTPFEQCKYGKGYYNYRYYKPTQVDAWKKMGQVFLSLGAGSMIAVTDQLGVVLNLNGMAMLPASGLVIEPSLGVEYGF